jgi:hypothetical protein
MAAASSMNTSPAPTCCDVTPIGSILPPGYAAAASSCGARRVRLHGKVSLRISCDEVGMVLAEFTGEGVVDVMS